MTGLVRNSGQTARHLPEPFKVYSQIVQSPFLKFNHRFHCERMGVNKNKTSVGELTPFLPVRRKGGFEGGVSGVKLTDRGNNDCVPDGVAVLAMRAIQYIV
jgi:hypothetical protein